MDLAKFAFRDSLLRRIISGTLRMKLRGDNFILSRPTSEDLYIASEIFWDTYYTAEATDSLTEEELKEFLYDRGIWSDKYEEQLKKCDEDLENTKVKLYEGGLSPKDKETGKQLIKVIKLKAEELQRRLHQYDYVSCEGVAFTAKQRYIIASCLRDSLGKPIFNKDLWREGFELLDLAIAIYNDAQLKDSDIRYLARTEPWRSVWISSKKCDSLFGCSAIDLTDEQRNLIIWSQMFDNIYESPDCPSDEVIADDDVLDGWLIIQKRKRVSETGKRQIEDGITNEKIKNHEEIYVVAKDGEEAKKIGAMNDPYINKIRKQRFDYIMNKEGIVNELEMPDTKQRLRMEFVQMQRQRGKS